MPTNENIDMENSANLREKILAINIQYAKFSCQHFPLYGIIICTYVNCDSENLLCTYVANSYA